ncbi:MAG: hypothetical protein ACP5RV_12120 [Thiomonas sp.]
MELTTSAPIPTWVLRRFLLAGLAVVAAELIDAVLLGHVSILETLVPVLALVWVAAMKRGFPRLPWRQVGLAVGTLLAVLLLTRWVSDRDPLTLLLCDFFLPLGLTGGFCRAWTRKDYIHPPCADSLWALWP